MRLNWCSRGLLVAPEALCPALEEDAIETRFVSHLEFATLEENAPEALCDNNDAYRDSVVRASVTASMIARGGGGRAIERVRECGAGAHALVRGRVRACDCG